MQHSEYIIPTKGWGTPVAPLATPEWNPWSYVPEVSVSLSAYEF